MTIEHLDDILGRHALFKGLSASFTDLMVGCSKNVVFHEGEYLCREGDPADEIFLVRHGHVGLEISAPGRGSMMFQTAGTDEVIGLSWLVPPYRWTYDGRAIETTRAISINAQCLREKCEKDHDLGYEVMKRFTPVIVERLHSTRLQLLDLYGGRG
ncbi:MAG TPA: cyclic nucleotide-binding domain-containing protein [Aestuariivirga sp.]|nr:cyclic nucleotide-binding domain-containing protein [Aestuariivirga sp.]